MRLQYTSTLEVGGGGFRVERTPGARCGGRADGESAGGGRRADGLEVVAGQHLVGAVAGAVCAAVEGAVPGAVADRLLLRVGAHQID